MENHLSKNSPKYLFNAEEEKESGCINKQKALLTILVTTLIIITSLQTLLQPSGVLRNVSAVEPVNIGVYWSNECTEQVTFIDWETLFPGSSKNIEIFIRNENTSPICFLFVKTEHWNPPEASNSMKLSLIHTEEQISPNEIVQATLTLHVSDKIIGIEYFEFNIIIFALQYMAGDVDHDGDVDPRDLAFFGCSYSSTPNDIEWNPNADFDASGKIDAYDFMLLSMNYGKKYL